MTLSPFTLIAALCVLFTALWFWFDYRLAKQRREEVEASPAGQLRKRILDGAKALPLWVTHIAADPDGSVYGYGYPPDLDEHGWESDRECILIGTDIEARGFWRESLVGVH